MLFNSNNITKTGIHLLEFDEDVVDGGVCVAGQQHCQTQDMEDSHQGHNGRRLTCSHEGLSG